MLTVVVLYTVDENCENALLILILFRFLSSFTAIVTNAIFCT